MFKQFVEMGFSLGNVAKCMDCHQKGMKTRFLNEREISGFSSLVIIIIFLP